MNSLSVVTPDATTYRCLKVVEYRAVLELTLFDGRSLEVDATDSHIAFEDEEVVVEETGEVRVYTLSMTYFL